MSLFNALTNKTEVTRKENRIVMTGNFGRTWKHTVRKLIGEKAPDRLFIKFGMFECIFYDAFIFEVRYILNSIIKNKNTYGINKRTLQEIVEQLEILDTINPKEETKLNLLDLKPIMKFTPLDYQLGAYKNYEMFKNTKHYRGMLLDAATGTGKTFMGLSIAEMLHSDKILVICPLQTMNDAWVKSVAGEEGDLVYHEKQLYYSSKSNAPYKGERILLFHYEAIEKLNNFLKEIDSEKLTILIDESHNFADSKSKRTLDLLNFINSTKSENIILLSGTPVKAYATEIINVLRFLDKRINGKVYDQMFALYAKPSKIFKDMLPLKYQAFSFKIEKDVVDTGLRTEYIDITLPNGAEYTLTHIRKQMKEFIENREYELTKNRDAYVKEYQRCVDFASGHFSSQYISNYKRLVEEVVEGYKKGAAMYDKEFVKVMAQVNKIEKEMSAVMPSEMKKIFKECKTIYKYPMLKIIGECLGKVILGARIRCHIDIAKNVDYDAVINSTHKDTIIFSNYVEVCEAAFQASKKAGFKPIAVYGSETKNLNKNVDLFKSDERINPMVSTYKALATGVRLTNANVILALDLPFRMYIYTQAISRAWRKGQDSETVVYIPTLKTGEEPNINQRNFDIISFFNNEVEKLTGYKQEVNLENEMITEAVEAEYKDMRNFDLCIESDLSSKLSEDNKTTRLLLW